LSFKKEIDFPSCPMDSQVTSSACFSMEESASSLRATAMLLSPRFWLLLPKSSGKEPFPAMRPIVLTVGAREAAVLFIGGGVFLEEVGKYALAGRNKAHEFFDGAVRSSFERRARCSLIEAKDQTFLDRLFSNP